MSVGRLLAGLSPQCQEATRGMVAWWPADSLEEALKGGALLPRDGAVIGAGLVGSAFYFSGGGSALVVPNSFRLPGPTFSVETWFRRQRTDVAGLDAEGGQFLGGSLQGASFGITHNGRLYVSHVGNVSYYSTTRVVDTNWHHAAFVREGGTLTFYLDGQRVNSTACPAQFEPAGPYALGALGTGVAGAFYGFLGSVDELAVYEIALGPERVADIHAAGAAGKCSLPGPEYSPIPVTNPGFEDLTGTNLVHFEANGRLRDRHYSVFPGFPFDVNGFTSTNAIPGWTGSSAGGTFNPPDNVFPNGLTDGQNVAWINVTGTISQVLSTTYEAGRRYRLEVMVGRLAGFGFPGYSVGLFAGGEAVGVQQSTLPIPAGAFVPVALTAEVPAGSMAVGKPIEIRLGIPGRGSDQVDFDRVRLWSAPSTSGPVQLPPLVMAGLGPNLAADRPVRFKPGTVGRPYEATLVVSNLSLAARTNVMVQLQIGPGLTLVEGVLESPGGNQAFATNTATPSVTLASLPANAAREIRLILRGGAPSAVLVLATADPAGTPAELPLQFLFDADSDADGMPDTWEVGFGLRPLDPRDAQADFDGDGVSNLGEYVAGTLPNSSSDQLRLMPALLRNGPSGPWTLMNLVFSTRQDRRYRLQARSSASPEWVDTEPPLVGNGGVITRVVTTQNPLFPPDGTPVFYRVVAEFLR